MKNHFAATAIAALVALFAIYAFVPNTSQALQVHSASVDEWGLTEREWSVTPAPDLRLRLGFPSAAGRVLAAAERGDSRAMAIIAGAYATGDGVVRDPSASLRWARASANAGLAFGHHVLALNYVFGVGTPQDISLFRHHMVQASNGGRALASGALGDMYQFAQHGVTKDSAMAARYYRLAAEGGVADYQYQYALFHYGGIAIPADAFEGERWMRAAAGQGHPRAQNLVQAVDIVQRWASNDAAEALLVAGFGDSLVGAHTIGVLATQPCVSGLLAERGQQLGTFLIDWRNTTVSRTGLYSLALNGRIELDNRERDRLTLSLHRDQEGDPEAIAKIDSLVIGGQRLSQICANFRNSY